MNRQYREPTGGVSVFCAQMIRTVFMLVLFLIMPMYSRPIYDQASSFLSNALGQDTGDEQANALQSALLAVTQAKVAQEEANTVSLSVDSDFEFDENTVEVLSPVKSSEVTSPFGWRIHPITGEDDFHTGIDIAAPKSTEITAPFDGTVTSVKMDDRIYGNCLQITRGNVSVFLAHCDDIAVKEGQRVQAREVLAHVGTTGVSTGYHLHFELAINNVRVNPLTYVRL